MTLLQNLESRLSRALETVLGEPCAANMMPAADLRFGDYQSNSAMVLAKKQKTNPRALAEQIVAAVEIEGLATAKIDGPGFINFTILPEAYAAYAESLLDDPRLGAPEPGKGKTVVVDFSAPNVAKPMHVGHIRSTIIGDSLCRIARFLGFKVIADNHIGDWGTQFGMLLVGWKRELDTAKLQADPMSEMERLYKKLSAECKEDPATLELAKSELVKLQAGDEENLRIWREMIRLSQAQFDDIYGRLGVKFDHTLGESFYNPQLKAVVQELRDKGIARESDGAVCVFSDGALPPKDDPFLKNEDGESCPNPFLIQKSDGAANYGTTDLATLAHRLSTWQPQEIVYVTDGRQQLHFRQLFATFRRWRPEVDVKLAHVWFGSILGEDGKPFKTRSGDTVKLAELLDEAVERAFQVVSEKNSGMTEAERRNVARVVGLSAVKYADLLPNRQSDYVFSWDKMLAFNGNTAPYLQYAYTRVRSIFRKAGAEAEQAMREGMIQLVAPDELALARHLLNFGLVIEAVAEEYRPNFLCNYLYELAGHYARFYENCPVLKAEGVERATRLVLCELTGRVLKQGLEVLGIEVLEQM